ncbi:MAG: secretion protein [Planctomycetota bacterium]|nr:MAG: secretion protein [Planctomycetota bacterium]
MLPIVIVISVGVGVAALVGAAAYVMRPDDERAMHRLHALVGKSRGDSDGAGQSTLLMNNSLSETRTLAEEILSRFGNILHIMEQADVNISASQFLAICVALAAFGVVAVLVTPLPNLAAPAVALLLGGLPVLWLIMKRKKRLNEFNKQLPEALELLSRSLRAGHSLGSGFSLVAEEMPDPIGKEFGRAFEEQNLGLTLEEALEGMTLRVPNMDLRFFATAVVLQRQTGGDLAEIMDKIGKLIRERFKLDGQIQALTGEGRLSGVVLLALPPVLFGVMLYLNYDYAMVLFRDETGRKLMAGALVMQLLGALVIRKIINIKV